MRPRSVYILLQGSRLYLGMYVHDFVYFSTCPQSELSFETTLESHLKVNFIGQVTWFLGIYFEWTVTSDTDTVHLSQEGYISELLRQNQMEQCNGTAIPYRSGLVIDRLPTPEPGPLPDPALTKEYQKLMGSYVWLNASTCPDLCAVIKHNSEFVRPAPPVRPPSVFNVRFHRQP
jgi:hypothetical protein